MPNLGEERKSTATRLGSYEILRMFARGGMAELFLARALGPQGFEKLVVLKKILPSFAENPRFVRLFLDEAKLAASLDHPHIAQVYDMGMVDGSYFFTMEYLHGQDVRSLLRRSVHVSMPVPIAQTVQVIRNVASALHYAHERRGPDGKLIDIVHRDVSPSNIIVSYDGAVKLLDFGVAKAATSSVKTRTGTLKGKVAYMSPEQARGASIDRRSDIFSLGIVLWEMVATRRLFKAGNDLATIQMIINEATPALSAVRSDCSPELERIAMKALAKTPTERYQTAQELQLDLEELARENKLNQSSIALSFHMNALFADEIRAWREAQDKGVTLPDHISSVAGGTHGDRDLTTPVSDSMLEFDSEEEDLDAAPHPDDDVDELIPVATTTGSGLVTSSGLALAVASGQIGSDQPEAFLPLPVVQVAVTPAPMVRARIQTPPIPVSVVPAPIAPVGPIAPAAIAPAARPSARASTPAPVAQVFSAQAPAAQPIARASSPVLVAAAPIAPAPIAPAPIAPAPITQPVAQTTRPSTPAPVAQAPTAPVIAPVPAPPEVIATPSIAPIVPAPAPVFPAQSIIVEPALVAPIAPARRSAPALDPPGASAWDTVENTDKLRRYKAKVPKRSWVIALVAIVVVAGGLVVIKMSGSSGDDAPIKPAITDPATTDPATTTAPAVATEPKPTVDPTPDPTPPAPTPTPPAPIIPREPTPKPPPVVAKPPRVNPPVTKPKPPAKPPRVRTPTPKKPPKPFDPDAPLPPS